MVYVTDGDPTAFDFNKPGDPFPSRPTSRVGTDGSSEPAQVTLDRAVEEANQVKIEQAAGCWPSASGAH